MTEAQALSLYTTAVPAGFPTQGDAHEENLDLNSYMVKRPAATFYCRVEGDSMKDAGIFPGDILVVDRSVEPKSGAIVIAVLNAEHTVKRVEKRDDGLFLVSENPKYAPIAIREEDELLIWGVVTGVVRKYASSC